MSNSVEAKLPSGAILLITPAPFAEARELFKSVLEELKMIQVDGAKQLSDPNLFKDLFCVLFSSPKVEKRLWECMKRVTYNGARVSEDTFEPLDAREDYVAACFEVAQINVLPFMKSLYVKSDLLRAKVENALP